MEFKKKEILNMVAEVSKFFVMQRAEKNSYKLIIRAFFFLCFIFSKIMKRPAVSFAMQHDQCDSDRDDEEMDL